MSMMNKAGSMATGMWNSAKNKTGLSDEMLSVGVGSTAGMLGGAMMSDEEIRNSTLGIILGAGAGYGAMKGLSSFKNRPKPGRPEPQKLLPSPGNSTAQRL